MKVNELMIGDWVKTTMTNEPEFVTILGIEVIDYNDIKYYINVDNGKYDWHCELNEIEPISLTPEILEKNDFKIYGKSYSLTIKKQMSGDGFEKQDITIHNMKVIEIGTVDGRLIKPIKYVHELQHILRLYKINKEIEL